MVSDNLFNGCVDGVGIGYIGVVRGNFGTAKTISRVGVAMIGRTAQSQGSLRGNGSSAPWPDVRLLPL